MLNQSERRIQKTPFWCTNIYVDSIVFCYKYIGIFYDQSSFIASKIPMYVINVNGTKTFIWKFINLVVPGGIWVKYSKLFYRVKAVDRNLLSAFRSFEMCNGARALFKSQMYFFISDIFSESTEHRIYHPAWLTIKSSKKK